MKPNTGQVEPRVGIFWLVGKRLIIDTTPLSEAGKYGDFKIHDGDHVTVWGEMKRRGEVPRGSDYEEYPRGRVNFNSKTQQFTLFADVCILRKKSVVKKLLRLMHLPDDTALSTDGHYRCFRCLQRVLNREGRHDESSPAGNG
jgi:hypothetical protein